MKLRESKSAVLFRFHDDISAARESIRILQYFNPETDVHILFGGELEEFATVKEKLSRFATSCWLYPKKQTKDWKWQHGDLMVKAWHKSEGKNHSFDFLFNIEYDLLCTAPLIDLYPNIDNSTVALTALTDFSEHIEENWSWTHLPEQRKKYIEFSAHECHLSPATPEERLSRPRAATKQKVLRCLRGRR